MAGEELELSILAFGCSVRLRTQFGRFKQRPLADLKDAQPAQHKYIAIPRKPMMAAGRCTGATNPARAQIVQAFGALRRATMGTTELIITPSARLLLASAARLSCSNFRNFFLRSVLNDVV